MLHPGMLFLFVVLVVFSTAGITSYIDGWVYDLLSHFSAVYHCLFQAIVWTAHIIIDCTLLQTQERGRSASRGNCVWLIFFIYALCIQVLLNCLFNCFIRATALLKVSHCCWFVSFCWCHRNSSCCSISAWQWRTTPISTWPFGSRDMKSWPLMSDCTSLRTKACVISTSWIKHSGCSSKSSFPLLDKLSFTENSTWQELKLFWKQHQF